MGFPKHFLLISLFLLPLVFHGQQISSVPLNHDVYNDWKKLSDVQISTNGNFISFEVNPQKGDGALFVYDNQSGTTDTIPRGDNASFTFDERFIISYIKPIYDSVRQAKIDDIKKAKHPKDSLLIYSLHSERTMRIARAKKFDLPKKNGDWVAVWLEKPIEESEEEDSTKSEEQDMPFPSGEEEEKEKEEAGNTLLVIELQTGGIDTFKAVSDFKFDEKGTALLMHIKGDSLQTDGVYRLNLEDKQLQALKSGKGTYDQLAISKSGTHSAFLFSPDTTDEKAYSLFHWQVKMDSARLILDTSSAAVAINWNISPHGSVGFSESGNRLFFGMAPFPEPADAFFDSIPEFEQPKLDVWNYRDKDLQPYQKENKKEELERSYLTIYDIRNDEIISVEDEKLRNVKVDRKVDNRYALGWSDEPYRKARSWDYPWKRDYYLVDLESGSEKLILEGANYGARISPNAKFVTWYDTESKQWNVYNVKKGTIETITSELNLSWHDEDDDHPMEPRPYGIEGFTNGDEWILIKAEFDIWVFDPSSKKDPWCITDQIGRKDKIEFNYLKLDKEANAIDLKETLYFKGFNKEDKSSGFYKWTKRGGLEKLVHGPYKYTGLEKAKAAEVFTFRRETFRDYPEVYLTNGTFDNPEKLSNTNPQQSKFRWGSVELTEWMNTNGDSLQGLIYKPYGFDPDEKYPMLVYFYEKVSDRLYDHRIPAPSRSIINPAFYTSRGYVVFMPDITYEVGQPGKSAYNAIMSGTMHMLEKGYVDRNRMGLQGQSWGGYQTAYLITQTDLFAAAMAGAPVSNMTSAYGGIRWGSGLSRMFQYEKSQSRLGATLWDDPYRYIENSPLFFANRVKTPLLMMHNDGDGAVPWYQGIEFFVALRRLGNPTWMLVYNGEEHNLKEWPNRKDLSIRMQQFFDHYLKGEPEPEWMKRGIPATRKGKETGYELD